MMLVMMIVMLILISLMVVKWMWRRLYFDETVGFFNFPVLKIFCSFHSKNILVFVLAINCKYPKKFLSVSPKSDVLKFEISLNLDGQN